MRLRFCAPAGTLLCLLGFVPASASTLRIPEDYATIAAGLAAAQPGDSVVIACGTYSERNLTLPAGVLVRSAAGDPACVTIDCAGQGRAFVASRLSQRTTLEGLTIRGGFAGDGGAILVTGSPFAVRDCNLLDNRALYQGGALLATSSDIVCEGLLVARNHVEGGAWGASGALGFADCDALVRNCTVVLNTYVYNFGVQGGGIRGSAGAAIAIDRSIVALNTHPQWGGQFGVQWSVSCSWSEDPLLCDASADDFRLDTASPCLPGGVCTWLVGARGHGCGAPLQDRSYTVATLPPGLPVRVDSTYHTTPASFVWQQFSAHEVSAEEVVPREPGTRVVFRSWSNGGERSHRLWATRESMTFTATYGTEHLLTMVASAGGETFPESGWHAAGASVTLAATPDDGFYFSHWEGSGGGSYSGPANPVTIQVAGPITQLARFEPIGFEFTLSASASDPHVHEAPPVGGPRDVYLWLTCARNGLAAMEADVSGTLPVFGFEPFNGVLNAGTATHPLLAIPGCPLGGDVDLLLGRFVVLEPAQGGALCLGSPWDGGSEKHVFGAVDCDPIQPFHAKAPGLTGFASDGGPPCRPGRQVCGTAVPAFPVAAGSEPKSRPLQLHLAPNPFRQDVEVRFALESSAVVSLRVYDVAGRLVRAVTSGPCGPGAQSVIWDGRDADGAVLPSGMYFIRLEAGEARLTRKILRILD